MVAAAAAGRHRHRQQQQEQEQQQEQQRLLEKLQQRKAEFVSNYSLPLNYPAKIRGLADSDSDDTRTSTTTKIRTSPDFINVRLLEAGLPLGSRSSSSSEATLKLPSHSSSLAKHSVAIGKFIRDLEGTGCYDTVQIHLDDRATSSYSNDNNIALGQQNQQKNQQQASQEDEYSSYDVTVKLREKKWYKLYIGGGVNSDYSDPTSSSQSSSFFGSSSPSSLLGGGNNSSTNNISTFFPKLQFETSASLLNLSGYADMSTASYIVDQTGNSSFKLVHDRPLISLLSSGSSSSSSSSSSSGSTEENNGVLYRWLMPDHTTDVASTDDDTFGRGGRGGGGSQTSLGMHAIFHDVDYESTRSSKEYVRSLGVRLANHSRGGGGGTHRPSTSPPESMAGPYLFLDWNASLLDVLPKRHPTYPYLLDCSPQIAKLAGTYLKHSMTAGWYWNGSLVNDRCNPTCGYDGHVLGEVAGPPGDVGYWKLKGGYSFHLPVEVLFQSSTRGGDGDGDDVDVDENNDKKGKIRSGDGDVTGMTLHSSFNWGILRPLNFNSKSKYDDAIIIPPSDRFYVGGPGQLRGFLPAGIGPRAHAGGSSVPGGDPLGGDIFYTSTLAASVPFPYYMATFRNNGARLFGFVNAGTCCSITSPSASANTPLMGTGCLPVWNQILQSTRVSIGGGLSIGSPMGRCELTYAVPIRYGPRDAIKSVQFGFGFSFG